MEKNITYSETVKEAITIALIRLMQKKDFSKISITEICSLAGVSRISFYRNFECKEDILKKHINDLYHHFFESEQREKNNFENKDLASVLMPQFKVIKDNRDFFTVLHKNGLLYHIFNQTDSDIMGRLASSELTENRYYMAMLSGSCAGIIQAWIDNDFRENEEEMIKLFAPLLSMSKLFWERNQLK